MKYTHEDLITAYEVWKNTPMNEFHTRQERWNIYCSIRDNKPLEYYQSQHDNKFKFMKLVDNKLDSKQWL